MHNQIKDIGKRAFFMCGALTQVEVPGSVTNISDEAFMHCSNLVGLKIAEGVISVGNKTFANCTSLYTVCLPQSISDVQAFAFDECSSLTCVEVNYSLKKLCEERNVFRKCNPSLQINYRGGYRIWITSGIVILLALLSLWVFRKIYKR